MTHHVHEHQASKASCPTTRGGEPGPKLGKTFEPGVRTSKILSQEKSEEEDPLPKASTVRDKTSSEGPDYREENIKFLRTHP